MGASLTREEDIPEYVTQTQKSHYLSWQPSRVEEHARTPKEGCTLATESIVKVGLLLQEYFHNADIEHKIWNVLEVFAGNGSGMQILKHAFGSVNWIATDLCPQENEDVLRCDALTSVELFGADSDVLVMVSPPPYSALTEIIEQSPVAFAYLYGDKDLGYADFFAVRTFLKQCKPDQTKWIVFVGELGVSDGSVGMYRYLMLHANLHLEMRVPLERFNDFTGESSAKELFVFKTVSVSHSKERFP